MVPLLYDVLIWLADLLFKVVALFHKKAAKDRFRKKINSPDY